LEIEKYCICKEYNKKERITMRMKNWKRITASALSICMLATYAPCLAEEGGILQAPVTVHAETSDVIVTGTCGKNATWNYNKTTKVMTITGTEITMMPFSFKRYKKEIKKLVFSGGITKITRNFFEDFTALEDIEFGGVKKIEDSAFKGCTALTSLNLNGNLKKIGNSAFAGCTSLTSLNLDGNLEEIGEEAFLNCKNLTTVTVGSKVKTVYYDIFKGCDNLTSITVSKDNAYLYAEGKKLLNANISGTCGKNITFSYNPKTKTLTFSGSGAMKNGNYGFDEDCNWDVYVTWFTDTPYRNVIMHEMQTLVIGDNITSIGKCAFVNCDALKTVKLGKNVSTIGDYAFTGCKALETIQSGSKITSIGKRAFSKCSKLNKMSAFPNITKIGNYSFYGCKKLKTFSIGKSVKSIGEGAFSECTNLRKFSIHKKNKYFSKRDNMLLNKQQTKIISACLGSNKTCNIYSSVKNIDKTILEDSSVKSFSVNKNNPNYSSKGGLLYSKNGKTLKKCPARMSGIVNIDDTVTSMDIGAFQICNNITQINIGKNVKSINLDPRSISANKLNKIEISKKE